MPSSKAPNPISGVLVVATWNHAELTERFFASLLASSCYEWKVIFVDNGSQDKTPRLLKEWQQRHTFVRASFNETNLGCAKAWNVGIREALSEGAQWVGIFNNDLVFAADWDRGLVEFVNVRPELRVVSPWVDRFHTLEEFRRRSGVFMQRNQLRSRKKMNSEALFVRQDVFGQIGLFDERFFVSFEDADFYLRLGEVGIDPVSTGASLLWHQIKSTRQDLGPAHETEGSEIFQKKWQNPRILHSKGFFEPGWKRRWWRFKEKLGYL